MDNGRRNDERRTSTGARRTDAERLRELTNLIEHLRMQASTRAAANRTMRVEPSDTYMFLEWRAANELESLLPLITKDIE